jgi:hypothetical protein
LTVDINFNETIDIFSNKKDEYLVSAYVLSNGQNKLSNNYKNTFTYDCDEGQMIKDKDMSMG